MLDDPNTNPENDSPDIDEPEIDEEDWQIAFEPYKASPIAAFSLGFRFMALKEYLTDKPPKVREAVEAIDLAIDVLFPFTYFHSVSQGLFRKMLKGQLTVDEEAKLKALGVKC